MKVSPFQCMDKGISLCMIVKDEEKNLSRCLDSVRNLVDEMIIVDTGSKDRTVEIAKSYGAKVHHFKWCNDFSAARNESLKYATREWIFSIDADEYIDEGNKEKIRKLLQNPIYDAYFINIKNFISPHNPNFDINVLMRLYRNIPGIYYTGKVHEDIVSVLKLGIRPALTDIFIYHTGYMHSLSVEEKRKKSERSMDVLKEWYNRTPDDPFVNFYLGEKYALIKEYDLAIKHFRKTINSSKALPHIRSCSYIHMIYAFNEKGLPDSALKWCARAFKLYPGECIFHILSAKSYRRKEEYLDAIKELKFALKKSKSPPDDKDFFYMEVSPSVIYAMLGENYQLLGVMERALFYYHKAVELEPDYFVPYLKLAELYTRQKDVENAMKYCKKAIKIEPNMPSLHFNLGNLFLRMKDFKQAAESFKHVISLAPQFLEAYNIDALKNLALCYKKLGNEEQAIDIFAKVKRLEETRRREEGETRGRGDDVKQN